MRLGYPVDRLVTARSDIQRHTPEIYCYVSRLDRVSSTTDNPKSMESGAEVGLQRDRPFRSRKPIFLRKHTDDMLRVLQQLRGPVP